MSLSLNQPELLVPAGNLSKLHVAFAYGADAVYVGAPAFGLRQGADNFSFEELAMGVDYAHGLGKHVYVALNAMPHQWELQNLQELLEHLEQIGPDALIVSDPGVFRMIQKHTSIPCHISTQASVTNKYTSQMWKQMGAKRVIVARELTMQECLSIKEHVDIELEAFVHGSMCTSYSGKCTISNYTAGRDANRGGCVHNCRYQYHIHDQASDRKEYESYIMNSRDLMAISLIPQLIQSGVDSFKIEGRMKSNLYVAQTARMYRAAMDHCWAQMQAGEKPQLDTTWYEEQLKQVSNRTFHTGSLEQRAHAKSLNYTQGGYERGWQYLGIVRAADQGQGILLEVRCPFKLGDTLSFLDDVELRSIRCDRILNVAGESMEHVRASSLVYLPQIDWAQPHQVCVLDVEAVAQAKAG